MIVRSFDDVNGTDREVTAVDGSWTSRRLIVAADDVGFSLHETVLQAGSTNTFRYANHVEAVWILDGMGTVTTTSDGTTYQLGPGTVYLLNDHDEHVLRAETELRTACVFTPPVVGGERHGPDGAYPAAV